MKKITLFCLIFSTGNIFGQQYVTFPTNAVWYQVEEFQTHPLDYRVINSFYILNGDTIISNTNYKKLRQNIRGQIEYVGALRENQQKEVFFYAKTDSIERLLYRFGLSVGDSLKIRLNQLDKPIKIVAIDSVQVGNSFRKRYLMNTQTLGTKDYWIEGIGSTKGLFYTQKGVEFENTSTLFCFEKNGIIEFRNTRASSSCTVATKELTNLKIELYPNPATDNVQFRFSGLERQKLEIKVLDLLGRTLIQQKIDSYHSNFDLNVGKLSSGIFFYELSTQNSRTTGKFYIQK